MPRRSMHPYAEPRHSPQYMAVRAAKRDWLLGLFLLGLVPRLLMLAVRPDGLQAYEYETLAQSIVAGQGYVIARFGHAAMAFGDGNLYSFLAASVYLVAGHQPLVLAVVQAVIVSLAAPVIFAIGRRVFGWQVAVLGAALAALHPGLLAYTWKLHPLGLDVLLLALTVLWALRLKDGARGGLMLGLTLGVTLMSRPTFFVAGAAALGYRWLTNRRQLAPMLVALAIALLVALPWVMRNWAVLGRPLFISSSFEDVWKGNNPTASGSSYLPNGQDVFAAAPSALQRRFAQASELQLNEIFTQEIVTFIREHPSDFAALTARKFAYFWWASPQMGMLYPPMWLAAYQGYAAVILGFALVGAVSILRVGSTQERALLGILAAIGVTLAVIHALAYVEGRHRWGVEPLLLLLTGRGMLAVAVGLRAAAQMGQLRVFRRESER
ncbi:MAG: glycosyltransferase family 39 protein [Chloroflexi bacterium]|nr:glycosyltransferase family 39 protein [Chloroflexota bacterium]